MIFSGPPRVPAGRVDDALVSSVDLFPTLLDYAGVPPTPELPGRSLRPVIEGASGPVRSAVLGRVPKVRADTAEGVLESKTGFVTGGGGFGPGSCCHSEAYTTCYCHGSSCRSRAVGMCRCHRP